MIKYTTSQFSGADPAKEEITGFMVDLWNDSGCVSCRTILNLPEGERAVRLWFFDSILAIPDFEFCFRMPKNHSFISIVNLFTQNSRIKYPMAAALAATLMVMEAVTRIECERWDTNTNLAECTNETMDFDCYLEDDDPLPF